jgi:hypothetical protein
MPEVFICVVESIGNSTHLFLFSQKKIQGCSLILRKKKKKPKTLCNSKTKNTTFKYHRTCLQEVEIVIFVPIKVEGPGQK